MRQSRKETIAGERSAGFFSGFSGRDTLAMAALGLLVAASYFPATRLGFVWDDVIITTLNAIREWSGIWDLWFAPGSAYRQGTVGEDHYWPLLYTTFWLEHKLWGFAPAGYHIVNILIHFANTALLWRLLRRLAVPGAWLAAAVFAVHPLHVESVTWVIARKDLLSALFYLAAVMTWFAESPRPWRHAAAPALFAAAMLCKSIAVTLPATLLLLCWWKEGRVTGKDLVRLLPLFLVGLVIATIDLLFYQRVNLAFDYTVVERTLIAAHSLWFYAGKLLWPVDLALLYPHWNIEITNPRAWAYVVASVIVVAALWFLRHRIGRGPLTCVLFFAVTLSPMLGFLDYGYMNISFAADRYQYLAGIGILVLFAGAAARGVEKLPGAARTATKGMAPAALLLLGAATWNQSAVYKDDLTLFSHSAATNPQSWAAHHYVAHEYFKLDRLDEAEKHFRRALELKPGQTQAHQNLGEIRRRQGRFEEAVASYRAVVEIDPRHALAYAGLGDALFRLRRHEEAAAALRRSLALRPRSRIAGTLHVLLGQTLQELARFEAAAEHFARAMALDPRGAGIVDRLAMSRFAQKRYREARDLFRALVRVNPDDARAHSNLGAALYYLGRPDDALRSFERALALDPSLKTARTGLEQARKILKQRGQ